MNSDADVIQFFEKNPQPSADSESILPSSSPACETDAESRRLQQALTRNLPMIKQKVHAVSQPEWSLYEYVDRLYKRLRNRLSKIDDLDQAIGSGIHSLVHEDVRNQDRRWIRLSSLDTQPPQVCADPRGLEFVTALVHRDKLQKFTELLDPWTKRAFYAVHIDGDDVPRAVVAKRMGMKENSFNKRLGRGIERAVKKFHEIYGDC